MSYSPRYNDDLEVKYILVNSGYNNRALVSKECVKIMEQHIGYFSEMQEIENTFESINDNVKELNCKINIVKGTDSFRLLYTHNVGYTWIDKDNKYPIY